MRKLASIQLIKEIKPIEGADRIEKIRINDWWCVSEKGNFKIGDMAVYFEIDSLLPSSNPVFNFLAKGCSEKTMTIDGREYKGYRLRTVKKLGILSQGLALPLEILKITPVMIELGLFSIGDDLSDVLHIVKYEPLIPAHIAGKVKGSFPSFLKKTDEERVQNLGELIKEKAGTLMYVTEKLDGASATFYKKDGALGVCSRNLELLETEGNTLWEIAKKYEMKEELPENIAIQGEIVGEGIQKNPLKLKVHDFFVFNVFDIVKQQFYNFEEVEEFCNNFGLKMIPILDREYILSDQVDTILKLADGQSALSPLTNREGIVLRSLEEETVIIDDYPARLSFKAISNNYLLANKE
ncbi:TPA: RNA ligase (ATP) [Candidatus Woesebacteria bacterium]|nr:RNA ligase (ATP) [Candidatus Woesebacteria bacterium]